MKRFLKTFWEDESGATAIEYGLIVGIMSALLVSVLTMFRQDLTALFEAISEKLQSVTDEISQSTTGK